MTATNDESGRTRLFPWIALWWLFGLAPVWSADESPSDLIMVWQRRFRIEVYRTYQHSRADYNRHIQAAESLLESYATRGSQDHDRRDVETWLQQATRALRTGGPARGLPAYPAWFGAPVLPGPETPPARRPPSRRRPRETWKGERVGPGRAYVPRATFADLPTPRPSTLPAASVTKPVPMDRFVGPQRPLVRAAGDRPATPDRARLARGDAAPAAILHADASMVDLRELISRVRGYNESIRSLETALSRRQSWSVPQMEQLVTELEDLEQRRELHEMYRKLVQDSSTQVIPDHRSPEWIHSALHTHLRTLLDRQTAQRTSPTAAPSPHVERLIQRVNRLHEQLARPTQPVSTQN